MRSSFALVQGEWRNSVSMSHCPKMSLLSLHYNLALNVIDSYFFFVFQRSRTMKVAIFLVSHPKQFIPLEKKLNSIAFRPKFVATVSYFAKLIGIFIFLHNFFKREASELTRFIQISNIVSSDRSSYSDDGILCIYAAAAATF